jgi:PKD repeat protein
MRWFNLKMKQAMKNFTLSIALILMVLGAFTQNITRGPDVGELYFLGPTHTGTGLYYSTDFGETAMCVDSISTTTNFIEAITADKTPGGLYYVTMGEALYYSNNYGQFGSWQLQSGGVSYRIRSGRNEGEFYNTINSHSLNYGISFTNHSLTGYFGNLLECEIDCESPNSYAIVFQSGITDSIYLLFTQDNYENIGLQNSFYVNYYSRADLTRGFNNGEIYLDLAQDSYTENLLLRSADYGETFDTIDSFNLSNFYQLDFEGGRQDGEVYILYNFVNLMWQNAHTYIYHSIDYGQTFDVYHPFGKGNEPVLANFSTTQKEIFLSTPIEFCNYSIGDILEYQWDFENDGIIDSYERNPVFTFADTGWYSVKLSVVGLDSTNSFIKEKYIHVIDTTTNINEKHLFDVKLSPNPVNNHLTIRFNRNDAFYKVSIYSLQGEKIKEYSISNSEESIIDFSNVISGIYLINMKNENKSLNYKIIKN